MGDSGGAGDWTHRGPRVGLPWFWGTAVRGMVMREGFTGGMQCWGRGGQGGPGLVHVLWGVLGGRRFGRAQGTPPRGAPWASVSHRPVGLRAGGVRLTSSRGTSGGCPGHTVPWGSVGVRATPPREAPRVVSGGSVSCRTVPWGFVGLRVTPPRGAPGGGGPGGRPGGSCHTARGSTTRRGGGTGDGGTGRRLWWGLDAGGGRRAAPGVCARGVEVGRAHASRRGEPDVPPAVFALSCCRR